MAKQSGPTVRTYDIGSMNPALSKKKILVLDDNQHFLRLISFLLKEFGIEDISLVNSYNEALELIQNNTFDILLLDIQLGEKQKTGIQLALEVRKTQPEIPVIIMTALYDEQTYKNARMLNPFLFLNKELSRVGLHHALEVVLSMQAREI
jgi:CheY-like chemotaxis protein